MNIERLKKVYEAHGMNILPVRVGQMLELHEKMGSGSNERVWKFKALVVKVKRPNSPDGMFTVRGVSAGVTVEKIYPLSFTGFKKIVRLDEYKVRRAKLYYTRHKIGKSARMKSLLAVNERHQVIYEQE